MSISSIDDAPKILYQDKLLTSGAIAIAITLLVIGILALAASPYNGLRVLNIIGKRQSWALISIGNAALLLLFLRSYYQSQKIASFPIEPPFEMSFNSKIAYQYPNSTPTESPCAKRGAQSQAHDPLTSSSHTEFKREKVSLSSSKNPYPSRLISYSSNRGSIFEIVVIEGKLVVLEKTSFRSSSKPSKNSLEHILLEICHSPIGQSINSVLSHQAFDSQLDQFIETAIKVDSCEGSRLLSFSNIAITEILEAGLQKKKAIDPLKILSKTQQHIFLHAASCGNTSLLKRLMRLFPSVFKSIEQIVVAEFLTHGNSPWIDSIYTLFETLELDDFHRFWLHVAKQDAFDEQCKEKFKTLKVEEQRILYNAAYIFNNVDLCEPLDVPIKADQYCINLMWINKNRIPSDQIYLFGNGATAYARQIDFENRFIDPVAKWAQANPGSSINIWVDSEMATSSAIKNTSELLLEKLKGSSHGKVIFRDVRSINYVKNYGAVFCEKMPIYFRVDLLRAIAADHVLSNKEAQYFVYGDIDMKPLSGKELFDKRTVNFLNEWGIVFAKGGWLGFENGFQILNGHHSQCMASHREVLIELSINMALEEPQSILEQQMYDTYPIMMTHLVEELSSSEEELDPTEEYRYDRFRNSDKFRRADDYYVTWGSKKTRLRDIMPRKPVQLPPSHL